MGTIRFFSGGRDSGQRSIASEILKLEVQKRGKLPASERFKLIMQRKMAESQKKLDEKNAAKNKGKRQMSKKAENALKEIAARKAAKESKRVRQMVVVEKKIYHNGRITAKGAVYDIAGNKVAQVSTKNGKMQTMLGTALGQYKPKSQFVNGVLVDAINKYSPYYINLRKMQAMQAAGLDPVTGQPVNQNTINVHGNSNAAMHGGNYQPMGSMYFHNEPPPSNHFLPAENEPFSTYGTTSGGPRQAVGGTAWGARSDNVWGTFTDNIWGTSADTVWGTNTSDVWGGVGGNPWGHGKSVQFWGTGNGVNYLKSVTNLIRKFFGRPHKETVNAFKAARQTRTATTRTTTQRAPARAPTPAPTAPTGRR